MKLKTSLRAGARGCSPEAQAYMEKALTVENKIARCLANQNGVIPPYNGYIPPYNGYVPPFVPPSTTAPTTPTTTGAAYPDRSGWCG